MRLRSQNSFYVRSRPEGKSVTLGTILLIILVLLLIGAIPRWPHSRSWGYAPSGGLIWPFGVNKRERDACDRAHEGLMWVGRAHRMGNATRGA